MDAKSIRLAYFSRKVGAIFEFIKSKRHISWALADQGIVSGTNFINNMILARIFGVDLFGQFSLLWMIVLFAGNFQLVTIIQPLYVLGIKYKENDDYYSGVLFLQIIEAALFFVLSFFGYCLFSILYLNELSVSVAVSLAFLIFFNMLQDFFRRLFFVKGTGSVAVLFDSINYFGRVIVLCWMYLWVRVDVVTVLWSFAIISFFTSYIGLLHFKPKMVPLRLIMDILSEHWDFSKWLTKSVFLQLAIGNLFVIVGSHIIGPSVAGIIRISQNLMGICHVLFLSIENFAPVGMATNLKNGGIKAFNRYSLRLGIGVTSVTLLFVLLIAAFPGFWIELIYGSEFLIYDEFLRWYVFVYVFFSLNSILKLALRTLLLAKFIFVSEVVAFLFSLATAALFIREFGIHGVTVGGLSSATITCFFLLVVLFTSKSNCSGRSKE